MSICATQNKNRQKKRLKEILMICDDISWPLNSGGKIRSWNFIESLKDSHEMSFLCLSPKPLRYQEMEILNKFKQHFKNFWIVIGKSSQIPKKKFISDFTERILNLLSGLPWELSRSYTYRFEFKIKNILQAHPFDVIFVRGIYQMQYIFPYRNSLKGKIVFDIDNIESRVFLRESDLNGYNGLVDKTRKHLNFLMWENYHKKHLAKADHCIVCSEEDKNYILKRKWTEKIAVIPNAVDLTKVKLDSTLPKEKVILFCGALEYGPNLDAVLWFSQEIFPVIKNLCPSVKLHIVGRNPAQEIFDLADNQNVFVYPNVADVRPYYEKASVFVVPLRYGGGTRVKIIKAGAFRKPVVTTAIGAEGLDLVHEKHCLFADDKKSFAKACLEVLKNKAVALKLAEENYQFVKRNYDLSVIKQKVMDLV